MRPGKSATTTSCANAGHGPLVTNYAARLTERCYPDHLPLYLGAQINRKENFLAAQACCAHTLLAGISRMFGSCQSGRTADGNQARTLTTKRDSQ